MKEDCKLIQNIPDIENSYIKFSNIEIKEVFNKQNETYITMLGYSYQYKIDDHISNDITFARFIRLNKLLENDTFEYIDDYIDKALYLNDTKLLEEKTKTLLESYLKSYFYNN